MVEMNYRNLKMLSDAIYNRFSFETFKEVLRESIGADADYAGQVWPAFQSNALAYIASRNPEKQGEALLQKAIELSDIDTGSPICFEATDPDRRM